MSIHDGIEVVQNCFNLPTYQRRLRHLQSITVRNLACPETQKIDLLKFQVYFTLHKDDKSSAFYTSEKITGSLNPTWQSFDLQRCDSDADLTAKFVVVRVWTGLSDSAFKVRLECNVHLSGLVYFADKLQVSGLQHQPDTLLFGFHGHIFCHVPSTSSTQLKQLVPDLHVPSGKVTTAVYVDQLLCRPSYSTSSLCRIHTVLRAIKQTHAAVQRIHSTIEDKLVSSSEHSKKLWRREELLIKVRQLRQELLRQSQKKLKEADDLERFKQLIGERRDQIKRDDETLKDFEWKTEEDRKMHIQSREMLVKENAQVIFRRKQIVQEMFQYIFRIKHDDKNNYYICNVKLPSAENYQGHDETMLAVALGMTCHLTIMISKFLNLPLRYPMFNRGSKSVIVDHIHSKLTDKEREFPLFGKGKEKFQYNYAVFLLNKNISQLRFYSGLGTADLRETLPNLKSLMEQRMNTNSPPQRSGGQSSIPSPVPTSFEGSLTSRPSLALSNSTSSFAPQFASSLDLDGRDSRMSSLKQGTAGGPPPAGVEPFDLSPGGGVGSTTDAGSGGVGGVGGNLSGVDFKVGYMLQDLLKPSEASSHHQRAFAGNSDTSTTVGGGGHDSERDFDDGSAGQENENHNNGVNGSLKSNRKDGGGREGEEEEEEKEDLFTSTEDSFFKVNKKKVADQILSHSAAVATVNSSPSSQGVAADDGSSSAAASSGSAALWPTGPFQSFKLVKGSAGKEGNDSPNMSGSAELNSSSSRSPSSPVNVPSSSSNGRSHNTSSTGEDVSYSPVLGSY